MLQELVNEINQLLEYKEKYECAEKDKKVMSDKLFEFMLKEYNSTGYEDRCIAYKKQCCKDCMYYMDCDLELPENIGEPIPSGKNWIPGKQICGYFKWW